jgi:hypothetical protein
VIEQFARESDSALLVLPDLFTATNRQSIIALAARHGLPAVYPFRYFVASGGLMSYGIEMLETYRQAASYVDRILKGERPSDLPVRRPTKFEFVIQNCQGTRPRRAADSTGPRQRGDRIKEGAKQSWRDQPVRVRPPPHATLASRRLAKP